MESNKIIMAAAIIIIVAIIGIIVVFSQGNSNSHLSTSSKTTIQSTTINSENLTQSINATIPSIAELNGILGGTWSLSNQSVLPGNLSKGIQKAVTYDFNSTTGYRFDIFIISFNKMKNASDAYNNQISTIRSYPNITTGYGTLNSDNAYGIFSEKIGGGNHLIFGTSPFQNYLIDIQLYSIKNISLSFQSNATKISEILNTMEPASINLSNVQPLNATTKILDNVLGGTWSLTGKNNLTGNNTYAETLTIENFSGTSGYDISIYTSKFNSAQNASYAYINASASLSNANGIGTINGALTNDYSVRISSGSIFNSKHKEIVVASGIFGRYYVDVEIYPQTNNTINENIVAPGMVGLLNVLEGAGTIAPNSTTSLLNNTKKFNVTLPKYYSSPLFINSNELNATMGGVWRFSNASNITSNLPTGGRWFIIENFTNKLGQNFAVSIGSYKNSTNASGIYNNGIRLLRNTTYLNYTVGSLGEGVGYTNVYGQTYGTAFQSFIDDISPEGNYIIEIGLSETNSINQSFANYAPEMKNVLTDVRNAITTQPQPGKPTYINANELGLVFGGAWSSSKMVNTTVNITGTKYETIQNFSNTSGYNVTMEIFSENNSSIANYKYSLESIPTTPKNSINMTYGVLNKDYAYTELNGSTTNNKGNEAMLIEGPYGGYLLKLYLYPPKNQTLSISELTPRLLSVLQYMET